MDFEDLANETLLELFEYLSTVDLLRAFYKLNIRFNHLLHAHFHTFGVDFRSVSLRDFHLVCHEYLPTIADHVTSLRLSNDDDTPQQAEVFLQHGLTLGKLYQLRSLALCDICSDDSIRTMMSDWSSLPHLTHLTLAGCYLAFDQSTSQSLIDTIWGLPTLTFCYLNISFAEGVVALPTVTSISLKYLFIWGIVYDHLQLNIIFEHTPRLEQCSILFNMDSAHSTVVVPHLRSSITRLRLHSSHIEENHLIQLLQSMPNLSQLLVEIDSLDSHSTSPTFNGYQWEAVIRRYLPHLQVFRLRNDFSFSDHNDLQKQVEDLLQSFRSSFWLKEHQWFVRCHWSECSTACLYTLPYKFNDLRFDSSIQYLSTCPTDDQYLSYSHVDDLQYTSSQTRSRMISSIRFMNIDHLSIELPIAQQLYSTIPRLDQITSLAVHINDDPQALCDFQVLINRMICLASVSFRSSATSLLKWPFFQLTHPRIRRLNLRMLFQAFSDEQCVALCHSPLGKQCEVLFVRVKKRDLLPALINNLICLRALLIQSEDDRFDQTNDDELVHWLRNHLPSTCLINRDTVFTDDIHIWTA